MNDAERTKAMARMAEGRAVARQSRKKRALLDAVVAEGQAAIKESLGADSQLHAIAESDEGVILEVTEGEAKGRLFTYIPESGMPDLPIRR